MTYAEKRCRAKVFNVLVRAGMQGKRLHGREITPALAEYLYNHLEELLAILEQDAKAQGLPMKKSKRLDLALIPILVEAAIE